MVPIPLFWPICYIHDSHLTFIHPISLYRSHLTFLTRLPSHFSDSTPISLFWLDQLCIQLNHAYLTFIPPIFLLSLSSHFYKSTPISLLRLSSHFYHYHLTLSIPSHFYDLSPPLPLLSLQSHFYELHLTLMTLISLLSQQSFYFRTPISLLSLPSYLKTPISLLSLLSLFYDFNLTFMTPVSTNISQCVCTWKFCVQLYKGFMLSHEYMEMCSIPESPGVASIYRPNRKPPIR